MTFAQRGFMTSRHRSGLNIIAGHDAVVSRFRGRNRHMKAIPAELIVSADLPRILV